MNPITSTSDDALVQEGASHSVSTGDETERTDTAAASEIIGVETEADLTSVAILSTNTMVPTAPVDYVCVTTTETNPSAEAEPDGDPAEAEIESHVGAEPEADNKVMTSARVKNVRPAETMETNVTEQLAGPEKKMRRVDGVPLVESEASANASSAGHASGETKSRTFRSDEARTRKNAKNHQRRRARRASISSSQLMTETDSAQEAEETEGPGK